MENLKDVLGKALSISKGVEFKVKIYSNDENDTKEALTMTYFELGTFLITKANDIKQIDILM